MNIKDRFKELTITQFLRMGANAVILKKNADGSESEIDVSELEVLGGLTATSAEINNAADVSARVRALTASAAIPAGIQSVELNHATVAIAATIASTVAHQGIFVVKDTSASGTAAHTLKLTAGTFDGTNNTATLNAPKECLAVYFDSAGQGTILVNVGSVGLSST